MQKTNNYNLNQWEASDPICRADFNSDNAAIDGALAKVNTDLAAVLAAVGSGGHNCRIAYGTYVGNGKLGASNPVKLTVDFYPVLVITGNATSISQLYGPTILMRPITKGNSEDVMNSAITVTWSDTGVQWYGETNQNNANGFTYAYVVVGYSL